jgi:hypothetical protein
MRVRIPLLASVLALSMSTAAPAVTPGWECIPTTAGQAVVSGGTGGTPSCASGTPVLAPTYVSSGVGGKPTVEFSAVNVQIVNGGNATAGTANGEGNLVIGYDETPGAQTGSHNLVLGTNQSYTSSGSVLGGVDNTSSAADQALFGYGNSATGPYSSVTGGRAGRASGYYASITGGYGNRAAQGYDSVSGGCSNLAGNGTVGAIPSTCGLAHAFSSIAGGVGNQSNGTASSIGGGAKNLAADNLSFIGGGCDNLTGPGSPANISCGSSLPVADSILGGAREALSSNDATYPAGP